MTLNSCNSLVGNSISVITGLLRSWRSIYGIKKIWASLLILGPLSSPLIFSFSCVVIESMSTLNFHAIEKVEESLLRLWAPVQGVLPSRDVTPLSLLRVCHLPRGDSGLQRTLDLSILINQGQNLPPRLGFLRRHSSLSPPHCRRASTLLLSLGLCKRQE